MGSSDLIKPGLFIRCLNGRRFSDCITVTCVSPKGRVELSRHSLARQRRKHYVNFNRSQPWSDVNHYIMSESELIRLIAEEGEIRPWKIRPWI